jgi:hypothetical protein
MITILLVSIYPSLIIDIYNRQTCIDITQRKGKKQRKDKNWLKTIFSKGIQTWMIQKKGMQQGHTWFHSVCHEYVIQRRKASNDERKN